LRHPITITNASIPVRLRHALGAARAADGNNGNSEAQASEIFAACAVRDSSMGNAGACHGPAMMADNGVARIALGQYGERP
jgi:hypothetical protein